MTVVLNQPVPRSSQFHRDERACSLRYAFRNRRRWLRWSST